jgi:hypothetical protein
MKITNDFQTEAENTIKEWVQEFFRQGVEDLTTENYINFCQEQISEDLYENKQEFITFLKRERGSVKAIIQECVNLLEESREIEREMIFESYFD